MIGAAGVPDMTPLVASKVSPGGRTLGLIEYESPAWTDGLGLVGAIVAGDPTVRVLDGYVTVTGEASSVMDTSVRASSFAPVGLVHPLPAAAVAIAKTRAVPRAGSPGVPVIFPVVGSMFRPGNFPHRSGE